MLRKRQVKALEASIGFSGFHGIFEPFAGKDTEIIDSAKNSHSKPATSPRKRENCLTFAAPYR
jgi:hypothetical protein